MKHIDINLQTFFLLNVKPHHLLFYMNNLQSQTVFHISMGGKSH